MVLNVMVLGAQDLVITRGGDGTVSVAGFSLDSLTAQQGQPAILLQDGGGSGGKKEKNGFKLTGLAIPSAISTVRENITAKLPTPTDGGVISEETIQRMLDLAGVSGRKPTKKPKGRKTRARKSGKSAKTKRQTKRRQ